MENALFGLLAYPVDYVAKSSVFAAYCAHGICPILYSKNYAQADQLKPHVHYLPGSMAYGSKSKAACVGQAAFEWYRPHRLAAHVATLQQLMGSRE